MIRTFIAVEISSSVRQVASSLIEECRSMGVDAKWVAVDQMHITLQFLGNVREKDLHIVCRSLTHAVRPVAPFDVICRGIGAFPHLDRPRVIWLGVEQGHAEFVELQGRVEAAMRDVGFRGESRRFEPHLTLGRLRTAGGPELAEYLQSHQETEAAAFDVSEVLVIASHLDRHGSRYEVLGRAELRG